jgi:hypothetical protein
MNKKLNNQELIRLMLSLVKSCLPFFTLAFPIGVIFGCIRYLLSINPNWDTAPTRFP